MSNFAAVSRVFFGGCNVLKDRRGLRNKGKYQSGQMGQTVNLLAYAFGGSNPSLPTKVCGSSSVGRALAFQAGGREFEPRLPLSFCCYSSAVEHFLGKEEVASSSLANSSLFISKRKTFTN